MAEDTAGRRLIPAKRARHEKFGGISQMTEWRWQKHQGMPRPKKIGGMNFYDESELDAWIDGFDRADAAEEVA